MIFSTSNNRLLIQKSANNSKVVIYINIHVKVALWCRAWSGGIFKCELGMPEIVVFRSLLVCLHVRRRLLLPESWNWLPVDVPRTLLLVDGSWNICRSDIWRIKTVGNSRWILQLKQSHVRSSKDVLSLQTGIRGIDSDAGQWKPPFSSRMVLDER